MRIPALCVVLGLALAACSEGESAQTDETPTGSTIPMTVRDLDVQVVIPGTRARVLGNNFLEDARFFVSFSGYIGEAPIDVQLDAQRIDGVTLGVVFPLEQMIGLPEGRALGALTVRAVLGSAEGTVGVDTAFDFRQGLTPTLAGLGTEAYPQTPLELTGTGFIDELEGQTRIDLDGQFVRDDDMTTVPLQVFGAVAVRPPAAPGAFWGRDRAVFVFSPTWVGVRPGRFVGEARVTNVGPGWERQSEWARVEFSVKRPIISGLSPLAASRGQRVDVLGQGFVGGDSGGFTVVRLEGRFTSVDGIISVDVDQEITPEWVDGQSMLFTFQVDFDDSCRSTDFGAVPGRIDGQLTPIIGVGAEEVTGQPTPLVFDILPTKQVVWLRFTDGFTESLRNFGLRSVSREIQARAEAVMIRDYTGINLDIRRAEPEDFVRFSIVEIGGTDPSGNNRFGLDNTDGFDECNVRLDDDIGNFNADSGSFGGIFIESFLELSPTRGADNPIASPRFDEIFEPFILEAARPEELNGGPRQAQLAEAIRVLGNLVGNTATHEVGHSLGLTQHPAGEKCGQYHNRDAPNQIMDCGADRPFEERAEIDGQGPATWSRWNLEYLQQILPVQ